MAAEHKGGLPSEAEIERWSREGGDDWGEFGPGDVRVVYPAGVDAGDVAAVRRAVGMTQAEFAAAFGILGLDAADVGAGAAVAAGAGAGAVAGGRARAGGGAAGVGGVSG